jgi:hypothetical protein
VGVRPSGWSDRRPLAHLPPRGQISPAVDTGQLRFLADIYPGEYQSIWLARRMSFGERLPQASSSHRENAEEPRDRPAGDWLSVHTLVA